MYKAYFDNVYDVCYGLFCVYLACEMGDNRYFALHVVHLNKFSCV